MRGGVALGGFSAAGGEGGPPAESMPGSRAAFGPAGAAPSPRAAKRPQPPRATGWSQASSARRAIGLAAHEAPSAHRPAYFLEQPGAPGRTRDDDDSSASDDDGGSDSDSDGRAAPLLECLFCRDTGEPEAPG